MDKAMITRRGFFALSTSLATMLAACGAAKQDDGTASAGSSEGTGTTDGTSGGSARQTITVNTDGGHAIAVSAEEATYVAVDVYKTGDEDGDEADFYGTNAAVYAEEGARLTLDDVTVTTDGAHANAVFSYGEQTSVDISNSTINTTSDCSGGIMVTGGGILAAHDLTVHTTGNSSAPIRSDRGGGTQTVEGGSYTSDGKGSPVIYSTADVSVSKAKLTSNSSQGVVVEGKNSVALEDCDLVASNTSKNSDKSDWYQAVMIYQSMSGDAAQGSASFSASGGSITNKNGDVFFVNNTVCTIALSGCSITNEDTAGNFLRAAAAGWGSEGSNGGQVTLKASNQHIAGTMLVDEVSNLNLYLTEGSSFTGAINPQGAEGEVYVGIDDGSVWELAADSNILGLTCGTDAIVLNGYTLTVGDAPYEEGTSSTGEAIEATVNESAGGPGDGPGGGEPPEKPGDGGAQSSDGEPPEPPSGEKPPAKPGEDS